MTARPGRTGRAAHDGWRPRAGAPAGSEPERRPGTAADAQRDRCFSGRGRRVTLMPSRPGDHVTGRTPGGMLVHNPPGDAVRRGAHITESAEHIPRRSCPNRPLKDRSPPVSACHINSIKYVYFAQMRINKIEADPLTRPRRPALHCPAWKSGKTGKKIRLRTTSVHSLP